MFVEDTIQQEKAFDSHSPAQLATSKKLDILMQLGVCSIVLLCLNPFDCLDFLMTHPRLYYGDTGWMVLASSCCLRQHETASKKYFQNYCLRKFVIHAIRRLGVYIAV